MRASASLATLPSPREKKARLDGAKRIRVVVRKRPLVEKELDAELTDVLELRRGALPSAVAPNLLVHEGKSKLDGTPYTETHQFRFDSVFEVDSQQVFRLGVLTRSSGAAVPLELRDQFLDLLVLFG